MFHDFTSFRDSVTHECEKCPIRGNLEEKELMCSGELFDHSESEGRHVEDAWGTSEVHCFMESGDGKKSAISKL